MRFIRQRRKNDCGVACVAMFAGVSYARAMAVAPYYPKDCLFPKDLKLMLRRIMGKKLKHKVRKKRRNLTNYKPGQEPKILLIQHDEKDKGHFILSDGVRYYDPSEKRPVLISRAKRTSKWSKWMTAEEISFA